MTTLHAPLAPAKPGAKAPRKCRCGRPSMSAVGPRLCVVCNDEAEARKNLEWIVKSGDGVLIRQAFEWLQAIDANRTIFRDAQCRAVLDEALDVAARIILRREAEAVREVRGPRFPTKPILDDDDLDLPF